MHVSFALFADAANLSQEGKLNILGVFDALQVAQFPAMHPRATLVVRLKGTREDVGNHTVQLSWCNPAGSELWNSAGNLDLGPMPDDVHEADLPLIAVLDLPMDIAGEYLMRVSVDGIPSADVRLAIRDAGALVPLPTSGGLVS
jgi:hypothetical protein